MYICIYKYIQLLPSMTKNVNSFKIIKESFLENVVSELFIQVVV